LPLVEFNMNSTPKRKLNKTPFQIDLGYQPTLTFSSELMQNPETRSLPAEELADLFKEQDILIKEVIREAREYNQEYLDRKRRPEEFQEGDFVMLSTKNIREFHNKLAPLWIGPLKIIYKLAFDTYELELPDRFRKVHPRFHVSKLKRVEGVQDNSQALRRINSYEDPMVSETDLEIDRIVDHKMRYKKPYYRVRYKNKGTKDDTWIAEELVSPALIQQYKSKYAVHFTIWSLLSIAHDCSTGYSLKRGVV